MHAYWSSVITIGRNHALSQNNSIFWVLKIFDNYRRCSTMLEARMKTFGFCLNCLHTDRFKNEKMIIKNRVEIVFSEII